MVRSSLLSLAALAASSVVLAASAHAAPPQLGGLSPFGPPSCFTQSAVDGCTQEANRIGNQWDVEVVGDRVYVSGSTLLVFARNADGSLGALLDCVTQNASPNCASNDPLLSGGGS